MYRICSALIEIAAAAVFIVPVWCVYHKLYFHSWKRTGVYMIFACYLVAVLSLVGFPNIQSLKVDVTVNLIPFIDMVPDFGNACLNVFLFVPFGFFLPVLWEEFRKISDIVCVGLAATVFIEISQIFTCRTTDVNDILTNTVGTLLGYFIACRVTADFTEKILLHSKIRDFYVICMSVGCIMFFLQPFTSGLLWKMVL